MSKCKKGEQRMKVKDEENDSAGQSMEPSVCFCFLFPSRYFLFFFT